MFIGLFSDFAQLQVTEKIKQKPIGKAAYETVVKICNKLNIELTNHSSTIKMDDNILELLQKYNFLDDLGIHTVNAVLNAEYERCKEGPSFVKQENNPEKLSKIENVLNSRE